MKVARCTTYRDSSLVAEYEARHYLDESVVVILEVWPESHWPGFALRQADVFQSYAPSTEDLELMALMDRQYLKTPFYGSRRMKGWLRRQGHPIGRKKVRRLMRLMGLEAIYRRPNTSKPTSEHRVPGEVFQEERVALLAAVETLPRVAEDSLNLASSLSK